MAISLDDPDTTNKVLKWATDFLEWDKPSSCDDSFDRAYRHYVRNVCVLCKKAKELNIPLSGLSNISLKETFNDPMMHSSLKTLLNDDWDRIINKRS